MAKKRIIKKSLCYIMSDLFTASFVAANAENADKAKALEVQEKILKVYSDYNSRLSNFEKNNAKAFFKQYKAEINTQLKDIVEAIEKI